MLVCLNGNWKISCGYFLIGGMTGDERANIINQCLLKLHDVGVYVSSVTCDGPSCNMSMMKALGLVLDPVNMKSWFVHPADPELRVRVGLSGVVGLTLPMARTRTAVRVPYTTSRAATLDKS